jgi:hypothetical protein
MGTLEGLHAVVLAIQVPATVGNASDMRADSIDLVRGGRIAPGSSPQQVVIAHRCDCGFTSQRKQSLAAFH